MKKILKIILLIFLVIMLIYVLFIVEESIRLSINKSGEPLIVFEENYIYDSIKYESLGFSFINKFYCKSDDLCFLNGQELWLFDKFLIWGWIS